MSILKHSETNQGSSDSKYILVNGEDPVDQTCRNDQISSNKQNYREAASCKSEESDDPWAVSNVIITSTPWKELTRVGKVKRVLWSYVLRQAVLVGLLYLFICSLDFLGSAFKLLAGKHAAEAFRNNEVINNPIAGLMMGVLATVLLQSSSTTTSIIVAMVGAKLLNVNAAIPIVMGANIGTSVTNTIVSITQAGDRNQFRRAFGGATVHDMFNWLSVVILLPLEVATKSICADKSDGTSCGGVLFQLSRVIVKSFHLETMKKSKVKLLKALTEPFTKKVIQIDKKALIKIAKNQSVGTITKHCVSKTNDSSDPIVKCGYLFEGVAGEWNDYVLGLILLFISLFILCLCLIMIVKILNSIFRGPAAVILKKFVNADMPGKCGEIVTGYLAIVIGAVLTILVQSSSIFTSTLTPLIGIGVITIDRAYPLTLGANIGTTFTAILSSLVQGPETIERSIQISMCHLFFNITGILIWYPLPFMRKVPISLAKKLGDTTAKYRWFAVLYLIVCFFIIPGASFGLKAACDLIKTDGNDITGDIVFFTVICLLILIPVVIIVVNVVQSKKPELLPQKLKSWEFLPLPLRSLKPLDDVITSAFRPCQHSTCCKKLVESTENKEMAETPLQSVIIS